MHTIYTTPGFIIESRPFGEAGKTFSVFTRDLGLIFAAAQGIRLEKSKLRYHAVEYSFGTFSFVRGKEIWRVTSAEAKQTSNIRNESKELIARIALLLRRLLHGEEAHPELFDCIQACQRFLEAQNKIDSERMKSLESLTVFRMLHTLGYVGNDEVLATFLQSAEITVELLDRAAKLRTLMNQHINKALKESHL